MLNFFVFILFFFPVFFFLIPLLSVLFFGISLFLYVYAKKKNKRVPNTYSEKQIKRRKILLIVSSIITAVFLTIIIATIIVINTGSISFM